MFNKIFTMIEVKNLNKIYSINKKRNSRGLVDVSFVLPSSGFVFILGKSGSGKSTLINCLGLLDKPTSGDILIDNKNYKEFTLKDEEYYRAKVFGFVFQDYQLLEELSVKENIKLGLSLINDLENCEQRIKEIISKVDLVGFEDRSVKELSGGEKQRVAIARALIKNPRIVFADEPTGNLDEKTSEIILNILKEYSQDHLVIMVSHDLLLSYKFADRRITLKEGLIINDEIRKENYENKLVIDENNNCFLPFFRNLNENENKEINSNIKNIKSISNLDSGFLKNKLEINDTFSLKYERVEFNKKEKNKLTFKFIKNGLVSSSILSFLSSLIVILILLIQTFISFNINDVVVKNFKRSGSEVALFSKSIEDDELSFNNIKLKTLKEMDESDKALIKGDSNNEFIDVVNYSIITNYSAGCINYWDRGYFSTTINTILHGNNPYPVISNGTALVTDTYLIDKFNLDDKNNILAGSLANCQNSTSLIITDLYADGIIEAYANNHVNLTYEQLIGKLYPLTTYGQKSLSCSCSIGCIVKTNYKEKYKEIFLNYENFKNKVINRVEYNEFLKSETFNKYSSDLYSGTYSMCYSNNPKFIECVKELNDERNYSSPSGLFYNTSLSLADSYLNESYASLVSINNKLTDDEVIINQDIYNFLREKYNDDEIINKELYIMKTQNNQRNGEMKGYIKLTIKGISSTSKGMAINSYNIKRLNALHIMKYAVITDVDSNISSIIKNAYNNDYFIFDRNSTNYDVVDRTTKAFFNLFTFIEVLAFAFLIVFYIMFNIRSISSSKHQIGILKALGMKFKDLCSIFIYKNLIFTVISIVSTLLLAFPSFKIADVLLIESYSLFIRKSMPYLEIFIIKPTIFLLVFAIILIIFIVSTLIPLLILKKITPSKIVNNKNE